MAQLGFPLLLACSLAVAPLVAGKPAPGSAGSTGTAPSPHECPALKGQEKFKLADTAWVSAPAGGLVRLDPPECVECNKQSPFKLDTYLKAKKPSSRIQAIQYSPGMSDDPAFGVNLASKDDQFAMRFGTELQIVNDTLVQLCGRKNGYMNRVLKYSVASGSLQYIGDPEAPVGLKTRTTEPVELFDPIDAPKPKCRLAKGEEVVIERTAGNTDGGDFIERGEFWVKGATCEGWFGYPQQQRSIYDELFEGVRFYGD